MKMLHFSGRSASCSTSVQHITWNYGRVMRRSILYLEPLEKRNLLRIWPTEYRIVFPSDYSWSVNVSCVDTDADNITHSVKNTIPLNAKKDGNSGSYREFRHKKSHHDGGKTVILDEQHPEVIFPDAQTILTQMSVPDGYNRHDYLALYYFLQLQDENHVMNGEKMHGWFRAEDPSTWVGVVWTEVESQLRVTEINWSHKELTGVLNLENFSALRSIWADFNCLSGIRVSGCWNLEEMYVHSNDHLSALELSGAVGLTHLDCSDCALNKLNLNGCVSLRTLLCMGNQLHDMDLTGLTELNFLNSSGNRFSCLDLSACTALSREKEGFRSVRCWCPELTDIILPDGPGISELLTDSSRTLIEESACVHNENQRVLMPNDNESDVIESSYTLFFGDSYQVVTFHVGKKASLQKIDVIHQEHPEQVHPEQEHPEKEHPEKVHPEKEHPEQVYPEQVHPEQEHPEKVYPEQVHPEQVHPEQVHEADFPGTSEMTYPLETGRANSVSRGNSPDTENHANDLEEAFMNGDGERNTLQVLTAENGAVNMLKKHDYNERYVPSMPCSSTHIDEKSQPVCHSSGVYVQWEIPAEGTRFSEEMLTPTPYEINYDSRYEQRSSCDLCIRYQADLFMPNITVGKLT